MPDTAISSTMLPPEILRILSACLVRDETPSNRALQLMAFCGVCTRWREFGSETQGQITLDGSADTQHGPKATLTRFRRSKVAHKRDLFLGASRLLTGRLLASRNGPGFCSHLSSRLAQPDAERQFPPASCRRRVSKLRSMFAMMDVCVFAPGGCKGRRTQLLLLHLLLSVLLLVVWEQPQLLYRDDVVVLHDIHE